jgi:hypothetical protein
MLQGWCLQLISERWGSNCEFVTCGGNRGRRRYHPEDMRRASGPFSLGDDASATHNQLCLMWPFVALSLTRAAPFHWHLPGISELRYSSCSRASASFSCSSFGCSTALCSHHQHQPMYLFLHDYAKVTNNLMRSPWPRVVVVKLHAPTSRTKSLNWGKNTGNSHIWQHLLSCVTQWDNEAYTWLESYVWLGETYMCTERGQ